HSDDNHAWVEVWVDGKWHFIGACEPDADLDLAWFAKPAKRAMLVNTTVFGDYEGPEDVLQKDPLCTKINVLENYAPVKRVFARVTDTQNRNIDSASVEFQLYNYAEFYPLFKTFTGKNGICSFKTGYGDLLVWAANKGKYGFQKIDVRITDTITIVLDRNPGQAYDLEFDMVPPAELDLTISVSEPAKQKNSERLIFEDGLRKSYEETFMDSLKSVRFAQLVNLNQDTLWVLFHKSYGNWRQLTSFISQTPPDKHPLIFPLLENISEKDLRDIDTTVLLDHLNNSQKFTPIVTEQNDFFRYILSPRVDNEFLKPYKEFFQAKFEPGFIQGARKNPGQIADWLHTEIMLNNTANYSRAPITPIGVYELKVADGHSIDICFVAICRSFGIPARLDPATKAPQYQTGGIWHEVSIVETKKNAESKGKVILVNPASGEKKPEYTIQYTLEEYQDGFFRTLDYEGSPLVQNYPCSLVVAAGSYLMVTGKRLSNGTVLAKLRAFEVKTDETTTQPIVLRTNLRPLPKYGRINTAQLSQKAGPGLIIAWIDPDQEPTKHFLADLMKKKSEFEHWQGKLIIVFPSGEQMKSFLKSDEHGLPENASYYNQSAFPVKLADISALTGGLKNLPVVVFINDKGMINFRSEGYRIGLGDDLLSLIDLNH
ncbi:MAG: hypothetical protein NTW16_07370, partial [Bacteroidetes bacterium]|nr:hypothetical protein [Bacteroidota bacterium]